MLFADQAGFLAANGRRFADTQNCASHDKRWRRRHDVSDQIPLMPKSNISVKNNAAVVNEYIKLIA
ncbi:MAG: hypothetical protein ABSE22_08960 [Xanthobacteraceae bacterium]